MTEVVNSNVHFKKYNEGLLDGIDHTRDVYIGRGSKWGNPFVIGKDGDRDEVIAKYREWIAGRQDLTLAIGELNGKNLVCWCRPQRCHGDVLIELLGEWKLWKRAAIVSACHEIAELATILPIGSSFTDEEIRSARRMMESISQKHGVDHRDVLAAYQDDCYLEM